MGRYSSPKHVKSGTGFDQMKIWRIQLKNLKREEKENEMIYLIKPGT